MMSQMQASQPWVLGICACLLGAMAGCLQDDPREPAATPGPAGGPGRPTVVAVIDSGVDPYHLAFSARMGGVEQFLHAIPSAILLPLTINGSRDTAMAGDASVWERVEAGQLYAFPGTRLLGISFTSVLEPPLLDGDGHGTATAALVLREDPEALVVAVQVDQTICDTGRISEDCSIFTRVGLGLDWAAQQPWIDVISVSLGMPGNPPLEPLGYPDMKPILEASRRAHDAGKLVIFGAGNTVVPPLASSFAGPPWVISVGGAQPARGGEAVQAAKVVDVVANYTDVIATAGTKDGYQWAMGTSFATPIVAGTLAKAIRQIRQAAHASDGDAMGAQSGVVPPVERAALRSALNASALTFAPTDWRPTAQAANDTRVNLASQSLPILFSPAQQGWGYVHGDLASEIARRVLENDLEPPPEKATAAAYQAQVQALREAYWSRAG